MLHETGIISEIVDEYAVVLTRSQLGCSSCKAVTHCGNGIVEQYLSGKVFSSKILNRLGAKKGEKVLLEIPKSSITQASMIAYMIPLFFFVVTSIVVSQYSILVQDPFSENEIIAISLLGLLVGFSVTFFYNRYFINNELYEINMVSIVTADLLNNQSIDIQTIDSNG